MALLFHFDQRQLHLVQDNWDHEGTNVSENNTITVLYNMKYFIFVKKLHEVPPPTKMYSSAKAQSAKLSSCMGDKHINRDAMDLAFLQ